MTLDRCLRLSAFLVALCSPTPDWWPPIVSACMVWTNVCGGARFTDRERSRRASFLSVSFLCVAFPFPPCLALTCLLCERYAAGASEGETGTLLPVQIRSEMLSYTNSADLVYDSTVTVTSGSESGFAKYHVVSDGHVWKYVCAT